MLLNEKFIYLELHKTGSSHTRNILLKIPGLDHRTIGKHAGIEDLPDSLGSNWEERFKLGNIRNPWEWYISLWAFGCMKKGMLYKNLTRKDYFLSKKAIWRMRGNMRKGKFIFRNITFLNWKKLYKDHENVTNFKKWLKMILIKKNIDLGEGYKELKLSENIGFLTFRYLKLYTNHSGGLKNLTGYESVKEFDARNNLMDVIFKLENLHEELLDAYSYLGADKKTLKNIFEDFQSRTNTSGRNPRLSYYDRETYQLVKEKERFIIEKYNYDYNIK